MVGMWLGCGWADHGVTQVTTSGRVYMEKGYDTMEIFEEELEQYFDQFKDLAETYPIFHGKQTQEDLLDEDKALGHFKVHSPCLSP